MRPLHIDVYSDIVCPWCLVGARRLEQALASYPEALDVTVQYRPFLLHPEAPPEGIDIPQMLRRKYGREPQEIFARAEAAARETDLALDLSRQSRSHSTVLGHTLLRHAAAKGTQRALAKDLFVAHFIDAKTISDPKVLAEVAAPHGFSEEETRRLLNDEAELAATRREAQAASERGIHGVPFFVFGERFAFSGAQRQEVFHAAISRTLNDERKAP